MRLIALIALSALVVGCGSGIDLNGSATLTNGTLTGNATVQTPLGTFTLQPPPPSPAATPTP